MKRNRILLILIAGMLLVSCSKGKCIYKYQYTTAESLRYGILVSHLGDYDHMTKDQIEQERIHQRDLVLKNQDEIVLSDTMFLEF
jgi:hypothetical protein